MFHAAMAQEQPVSTKREVIIMNETTKDTTAVPKSRKKLIALIAAGALVVAGGVGTIVGLSAYTAETTKLCAAAQTAATSAVKAATAATTSASDALKVVQSTVLPGKAGTSTDYAKRPAVEAVVAVKATATTPEVKAVAARPAGAELIKAVAGEKLSSTLAGSCETRDQAASITKAAKDLNAKSAALESKTNTLLADFADFQKSEVTRIAAEKEAAAKAAAEKKAAAAQRAAEQAAAEQAPQWTEPQNNDSVGDTPPAPNNGDGGGGGNTGGGGGGTIIVPPGGGSHSCPADMICHG